MKKDKLSIIHLEDNIDDQKAFKILFESGIKLSLISFFTETFSNTKEYLNKNKEFTPELDFELIQFSTVPDFVDAMICFEDKDRKSIFHLSNNCQSTILFIFDYYLPDKLPSIIVNEMPFEAWFAALFPHIPVLKLTSGDPDKTSPICASEVFLSKGDIDNPEKFIRQLSQYYSQWWKPHFWISLEKYAKQTGRTSWHTPGHNAGSAFQMSQFQRGFYNSYGYLTFFTDLSVSVDTLGDLSEPDLPAPLKQAQQMSADIFGAEDTFYITNGTSTSNKAMLMTLLKPGETVLLDRNCHKSVHQAIVMSGAKPIYLIPAYNEKLGIWSPLSMDELIKNITRQHDKKPRILILTSCSYEGILYPIQKISQFCEDQGIIFYADEAWAPYLRFHPAYSYYYNQRLTRYNAIDGGAHFAVQSTHKALAAFSQASMIHISKRFRSILEECDTGEWDWLQERFSFKKRGSYSRFKHTLSEMLRYWHSTSPHYPMLATLDKSAIQMRLEGMHLLEERIGWVEHYRKRSENIVGSCFIDKEHIIGPGDFDGYFKDPLKIVIGFKEPIKGKRFKQALSDEYHIQWEKSTQGCIEFLVTIGTTKADIKKLFLEVVPKYATCLKCPNTSDLTFDEKLASGQVVVSPRDAVFSSGELVQIEKSIGRVAAQMLVPYPPGIPLFLPGLEITERMVQAVNNAIDVGSYHDVHGIYHDSGKNYIKVMA